MTTDPTTDPTSSPLDVTALIAEIRGSIEEQDQANDRDAFFDIEDDDDLSFASRFDRNERLRPDPAEFDYTARWKAGVISEIIPGRFYLGCDEYLHSDALQASFQRLGVTHILDARTTGEVKSSMRCTGRNFTGCEYVDPTKRFRVAYNPTDDDARAKSTSYFRTAILWAEEVAANGGVIYAHCAMGINRGPSNLYAIMRAQDPKMDTLAALTAIRKARPVAGVMYWRDADDAIKEIYGR